MAPISFKIDYLNLINQALQATAICYACKQRSKAQRNNTLIAFVN